MSKYRIEPSDQIQRLDHLDKRIAKWKTAPLDQLKKRPNPKAWCVLEVVQHMVMAHQVYVPKITAALGELSDAEHPIDHVIAKSVPRFLLKRFPPKEGKIRFKMKTMKVFRPILDPEQMNETEIRRIFDQFEESIDYLKESVNQYRSKRVWEIRFPSAVGAWVSFNVAEAVEFILCHNERHFKQIENTLDTLRQK